MNKSWTILIILAIITLIVIAAYEFYISSTGGNIQFAKQVNQINADLGKNELLLIDSLDGNVLVKDSELIGTPIP